MKRTIAELEDMIIKIKSGDITGEELEKRIDKLIKNVPNITPSK